MEWKTKYFNSKILEIEEGSYLYSLKKAQKQDYFDILKQKEQNFNENLNKLKNFVNNDSNINYKLKNSLYLIRKEQEIISLLNKYCLKNNKLDLQFMIKSLEYIFNISEILRKRLNQKEIKNRQKTDIIQRCSYKFCKFKENCIYNYKNKKNICYQDHYVHNMVSMDIKELLKFFRKIKSFKNGNQNVSKSINTLNYVINHMEKELNSRCLYIDENEIENEHISKSKK